MIETLKELDKSFFLFLNSFHQENLNSLMEVFSGKILWAPLIILALFHSYKSWGKKGLGFFTLFLALTMIATDITSSYVFKNIFLRLRPCRDPELENLVYRFGQKCGGRFGFISSHAANTFGIVTFYLGAICPETKWKHLLWIFPILVSFSRIYLGVHFPGDILVGAIVGLAWGNALVFCFKNSYGANR